MILFRDSRRRPLEYTNEKCSCARFGKILCKDWKDAASVLLLPIKSYKITNQECELAYNFAIYSITNTYSMAICII